MRGLHLRVLCGVCIFARAQVRLGRRLTLADLRPCPFNLFHGRESWFELFVMLGDEPDDAWRRFLLREAGRVSCSMMCERSGARHRRNDALQRQWQGPDDPDQGALRAAHRGDATEGWGIGKGKSSAPGGTTSKRSNPAPENGGRGKKSKNGPVSGRTYEKAKAVVEPGRELARAHRRSGASPASGS